MGGLFILAFIPVELIGQAEECAEQCDAIVVDQLDEAGLLDEAAEFDQVAGSRAPVLDPLPAIVSGARQIEAVTQHGVVSPGVV